MAATESLTLSDGTDTLRTNVIEKNALTNPPKIAYSARYEYSAPNGSSVSSVSITLNDYSNEVTVSGNSSDQVETIARTLQARFDDYSVWSGQNFRLGLFVTIWLLSIVAGVVLSEKLRDGKFYWFVSVPLALALLTVTFSGLHILPGTSIYAGDPSFWSRYGPQVGALSLLLAIVVPVLQTLRKKT